MILFKQYTLTATAVQLSDSTIFGSVLPAGITKFNQLFLTNAPGAANPFFLGPSTVTNVPANAGLAVGFSATLPVTVNIGPFAADSADLRDLYIVGTVAGGNIAYLMVVI